MANKREGKNENTLTNEIADIVRERILKGEYEIGEKIKESSIATELSVSRTPIREAFKMLEEEGLLDYLPNRGCYAKGFTKRDVSDIYAVREALEELAMTWACERITDEEIERLEEQCELMEFYTRKKDAQKILAMNSTFHDIIYNSTRSRFLAQVLRSYKGYLDKSRKSVYYDETFLEDIQKEHRALLEAVRERNVEEALEAIHVHLSESRKRTESVWNLK
ncbi:MAG: GntR family transcriptional regulator [Firmicutes bacterium]|nr:GntR family transcriptional regulator [Bacillota bacterium]